jgi:hypothetical protein
METWNEEQMREPGERNPVLLAQLGPARSRRAPERKRRHYTSVERLELVTNLGGGVSELRAKSVDRSSHCSAKRWSS